jgi:hypothetical protein
MKTVGVFDAKNRLSELIESGEAVTITKHGGTDPFGSPLMPIVIDANIAIAWFRAG